MLVIVLMLWVVESSQFLHLVDYHDDRQVQHMLVLHPAAYRLRDSHFLKLDPLHPLAKKCKKLYITRIKQQQPY